MIIVLWLISGLIGSLLIYQMQKADDKNHYGFTWCPSPIEILAILVGSWFGPFILTTAIIVYIIESCKKENSWLTRPICRKK